MYTPELKTDARAQVVSWLCLCEPALQRAGEGVR